MKRTLMSLLFVLASCLFAVGQSGFIPIADPSAQLRSVDGDWVAGFCLTTGFFNLIHYRLDSTEKTLTIVANGLPGTSTFNDFSAAPFVWTFRGANAYQGSTELTYFYSTILPDDSKSLGAKGDRLDSTSPVIPLNANHWMALYFRRNFTQDKDLYEGILFAYRSSYNNLDNFAEQGRGMCDAIHNLPAKEQGAAIRKWADQ